MEKTLKNTFFYNKKYTYVIIILFCLLISYITFFKLEKILDKNNNYKFETLESIEKYTNFYPETYKIENNDWEDPSFTNLYKKILNHSIIEKILVKLGIKDIPIWNVQNFQNLIKKVTQYRIDKKLAGPFDKTLILKQGDKCIIFGGLHAALHSFIRDLKELENQKIIDNNLNIISKNTYLIFLGDAIDRAPYSLEILNTILLLIDKNPEKVIYLQGNHETNSYWQNFCTVTQIKTLFPKVTYINQKNNLYDQIDNFFNTLSNSLTIEVNGSKEDKFILSYAERKKLFENNKNIKFMILGEKRSEVLTESNGLDFIGYDDGVAKWSTMNNPTIVYQKFFNFYYDVFLELLIGNNTQNCILTLNNRNINEKVNNLQTKIYKQTCYDPIFGKELKNKVALNPKNILHIGSTTGLTGIVKALSNENKIGVENAIVHNNKNNKNLIIPVIIDDGYSAIQAKSNVNNLLNTFSINNILSPVGTSTLASYIDMVKSGKIFVFFPYTGADAFRNKDIKNIIHFRASYTNEVKNCLNYILKEYKFKNFAFFYQDDAFGEPMTKIAHEELKKAGITQWIDLPHKSTQSNFKKIIENLQDSPADVIGLFAVRATTEQFIEELGAEFFSGKVIFGPSILFSEAVQRFLNAKGIQYVFTAIVPNPDTSKLEIAKEFKQNMNKVGAKIGFDSFEGYISGTLISEAINKIKPPLTGDKIIKYFEAMKNYKFKGLNLTFNPETRDLSQPIWIKTLDNKWIEINESVDQKP